MSQWNLPLTFAEIRRRPWNCHPVCDYGIQVCLIYLFIFFACCCGGKLWSPLWDHRNAPVPLDSHLTSLCKSRPWWSADISDSSMWNKLYWRLDVHHIKWIVAIIPSIIIQHFSYNAQLCGVSSVCGLVYSYRHDISFLLTPFHVCL